MTFAAWLQRHAKIATLCLVAVLLIVRRWHLFLDPYLFAEDGSIFWLGNYELGLRAFLEPAAGYYHLIPRLIAFATGLLDPAFAPTLFLLFAVAGHLLVVGCLFSPRVELPHKPLLALLTVLVPHTTEVFANVTNLQWVLAIGFTLLALAKEPDTGRQRAFDFAALFLLGLTGPFSIPLFPVFALRFVRRRTVHSLLLALFCMGCAVLQGLTMLKTMLVIVPHPTPPLLLFSALGFRTWGQLFSGFYLNGLDTYLFWITVGVAATVFVVNLAVRQRNEPVLMLTVTWLALVAVVALKFRNDPGLISTPDNGDRYFYVPHVLMLWSLLLLMKEPLKRFQRWGLAAAVVASLLLGHSFFVDAKLDVASWKEQLDPVRKRQSFQIHIAPGDWCINHTEPEKR